MIKSNGTTGTPPPMWISEATADPLPGRALISMMDRLEEAAPGFTPEQAIMEALRCRHCKEVRVPCAERCPAGIDIPRFVALVATGDFRAAHELLSRAQILPAISGRVCLEESHCRAGCIARSEGGIVSIAKLERFVGDWFNAHGEPPSANSSPPQTARVAVIGSGPAGLTCAASLARLGYGITVFEALHQAGGQFTYGIPKIHLPRKILNAEVDSIRNLGVTFCFNSVVGKAVTVRELIERRGYKAVFIGAGAGMPLPLEIPGIDLKGVYHSQEFLTQMNLVDRFLNHRTPDRLLPGHRVVVAGGGDSAVECARTARRLGAQEVTVLVRRSLQELKAHRAEVESAHEEGVQFLYLTAPRRLIDDQQGFLKRVECVEMESGDPDSSGAPRLTFRPGTEFQLTAEIFVIAVGQQPSATLLSLLNEVEMDASKRIKVDPATHGTSIPGVFAGGNITANVSVAAAMIDGREAARGIDNYLRRARRGESSRQN